ncbi:hypothetical protein JCM33374_g3999 [Metschnikowia sp. JCM 33374]|nr:hypothetical protein JCM33374_g3999 [Metschnikowia sp. JCM 33374]
MVPWNAMTLFAGQSKSFSSCKFENNHNFDTWDDYADMGESVSETILAFNSYAEEISCSSQRFVNIDLLDNEEDPVEMVDSR